MSTHAYTQQDSHAPLKPVEPDAGANRRLLIWAKQLSQEKETPRVHITIDCRHYLFQRGHLVATSRRQDG